MCQECQIAAENHAYRLFNPLCIYCGARLIQLLASLPISQVALRTRRLAVLDDWESFKHNREELRALAKGPICTGPVRVAESGDPLQTKRRSARKKSSTGSSRG